MTRKSSTRSSASSSRPRGRPSSAPATNPDTYPGSIGVFAGSEQSTYLYQLMKNTERLAYADPTVLHIGNDKDYLTTQVSYKLNLKGPSVAVQTACSTSLVAVGLACQSLWSQQSDMALAGGVSVSVPQRKGYWYMPGGIFSPDGHCRTFDASGQGTVVGNGVGIVLLKRLSDALADGDQVLALIGAPRSTTTAPPRSASPRPA